MTKIQLIYLRSQLKVWCKARRLSVQVQKENVLGNILEELTEKARAKSVEETIDAICDIMVFYINATEGDIHILEDKVVYNGIDFAWRVLGTLSVSSSTTHPLNQCVPKLRSLGYDPYKCMLEVLQEISSRKGEWDDTLGKFKKYPGAYSLKELEELFPEGSIKELEDKYEVTLDGTTSTFIKWYKADYSKCKLGE